MSVIDADAMVAALTPPSVVIGGHTYTGRLLSFVQAESLRVQSSEANTPALRNAFAVSACEAVGIDTTAMFTLPQNVMWQVIGRFFDDPDGAPGSAKTTGPNGSADSSSTT
jgi:hypothetical protein